jgi:hypothetical protein
MQREAMSRRRAREIEHQEKSVYEKLNYSIIAVDPAPFRKRNIIPFLLVDSPETWAAVDADPQQHRSMSASVSHFCRSFPYPSVEGDLVRLAYHVTEGICNTNLVEREVSSVDGGGERERERERRRRRRIAYLICVLLWAHLPKVLEMNVRREVILGFF